MGTLNVHWNIPAVISADDDLALEVKDEDSRRHHRVDRLQQAIVSINLVFFVSKKNIL